MMKRRIIFTITTMFVLSFLISPTNVHATDLRFYVSNGIQFSDPDTAEQTGDFVYYSQNDTKWKDHSYGSSTIGPSGCGPSSLAMIVATLVDKSVTPVETADLGVANGSFLEGSGTIHLNLIRPAAEKWGFKYQDITGQPFSVAIEVVKSGGLVYMGGRGPAPFTGDVAAGTGGHIIVMRGVTADGKVIIGDPYRGAEDIYTQAQVESYRFSTYGITAK